MDFNYDSLTGIPTSGFDLASRVGSNPVVLGILIMVIVVYYILFASLGSNADTSVTTSGGLNGLEVVMWGLFVVLILTNGMQYFFNVDVSASVKHLLSQKPEIDVKVVKPISSYGEGESNNDLASTNTQATNNVPSAPEPPRPESVSQVFHVSDNLYTYEDAEAICKAMNSELATYDQIENAYKSGAEWCSYGWSKDQMAYFPTQKSTFEKLQLIEGHEHDCGRPGINGGYIANPKVRFGVNCYGPKPGPTFEEKQLMKNALLYPKTDADIKMEERVQHWKNKLSTLELSPFNKNSWNAI